MVVSAGCAPGPLPVDSAFLFFLLLLLWEGGARKPDEHLAYPVVFLMSFGGQRDLQPSLGCGQRAGSSEAEQRRDALA